ncbi:hypothetical protein B0H13DRAFT_672805 [Mycena leptocephala]|nr:hypothetical protein B0H13DRAFT_672805 [Mycena leptocephala]
MRTPGLGPSTYRTPASAPTYLCSATPPISTDPEQVCLPVFRTSTRGVAPSTALACPRPPKLRTHQLFKSALSSIVLAQARGSQPLPASSPYQRVYFGEGNGKQRAGTEGFSIAFSGSCARSVSLGRLAKTTRVVPTFSPRADPVCTSLSRATCALRSAICTSSIAATYHVCDVPRLPRSESL